MTDQNALYRYVTKRDPDAFKQLVDAYEGMVYAVCARTLAGHADVDDAVQETFIKLATKAGQIRTDVAAWLHRCAVTTSIDVVRRSVRRREHEASHLPAPSTSVDDQIQSREVLDAVDRAIADLADEDQRLIVRYYLMGRPQKVLAQELKMSQPGLNRRLHRAVERLRVILRRRGVLVPTVALMAFLAEQTTHAALLSPALSANLNKIGISGIGAAPSATSLLTAKVVGTFFATLTVAIVAVAVAFPFWRQRATSAKPIGSAALPTAPIGTSVLLSEAQPDGQIQAAPALPATMDTAYVIQQIRAHDARIRDIEVKYFVKVGKGELFGIAGNWLRKYDRQFLNEELLGAPPGTPATVQVLFDGHTTRMLRRMADDAGASRAMIYPGARPIGTRSYQPGGLMGRYVWRQSLIDTLQQNRAWVQPNLVTEDGYPCCLIESRRAAVPAGCFAMHFKLWLDPASGFMPRRVEEVVLDHTGQVVMRNVISDYQLTAIAPDVWLPTAAVQQSLQFDPDGNWQVKAHNKIELTVLSVNQGLDDQRFVLEFPAQTGVMDGRTDAITEPAPVTPIGEVVTELPSLRAISLD